MASDSRRMLQIQRKPQPSGSTPPEALSETIPLEENVSEENTQVPAPTDDAVAVPVVEVEQPKAKMTNPIFMAIQDKDFQQAAVDLYEKDPAAGMLLCHLLEYLNTMQPSTEVTEQDGMRRQLVLYRTMVNVLKYDGEYGARMHAIVLHIFDIGRHGAFDWTYVNRFMENITLNAVERKAFTAMTLMFSELAKATPATRRRDSERFFASANHKSIVAVVGEEAINRFKGALRLN